MIIMDWHRLFGMALTDYFSDTSYTVELEKDLSLKKQHLDVVIVEQGEGLAPFELADGLENMAAHNLISYKSLREPFDDWAADELIGLYVNYRKQISPSLNKLLSENDFRLYAVCTRFPRKLDKLKPFQPVSKGVYAIRWGVRDIRLIVTGRISQEKRNALWLMFSAIAEKIKYGVTEYKGKLSEMSSTINLLLIKYRNERIITMPYTIEDYREELKRNVLRSLTLEERIKGISAKELLKVFSREELLTMFSVRDRLKGLSTEEIEAYLTKLRKKSEKKR